MKNFYNNNDITKIITSLNINLDLLNKKNILITGAFGFIGKYILETLITLKKNITEPHENAILLFVFVNVLHTHLNILYTIK